MNPLRGAPATAVTTAVCVFAKPPRPGVAKTRLGETIGPAAAARLARAFLRDTWTTLCAVGGVTPILAPSEWPHAAFGDLGDPAVVPQGVGDLGQRLERVLRTVLAYYPRAVAIGADAPHMPAALLYRALAGLAAVDAVVGPAEDGGFYLLGLRRCPVGLFADVPWSTATTARVVRERIRILGLSSAVLPACFDVDTAGDLERLAAALAADPVLAPATRKILRARGFPNLRRPPPAE